MTSPGTWIGHRPDDPWFWEHWHLSGLGLLLAMAWVITSMSPSLLPRTWWTQGLVMGACAAAGYGAGVLLHQLARWVTRLLDLRVTIGRHQRNILALAVPLVLIVVFVWSAVANIRSQAVTAGLVELQPLTPLDWGVALALMVVVFALLIGLARLTRRWYRGITSRATRFMSHAVAGVAAVLVIALVSATFTDLVVVRTVSGVIGRLAAATDQSEPAGRSAPTSPLRSAGPGSTEAWDSLGYEGQRFVSGAPRTEQIATGLGVDATTVLEPIRVYASINAHDTLAATAAAVVQELERTHAFDRRVLAVFTTTGTGWVNEWSTQSIEYLTGGDSAIAAIQYSDLPSPVALFADRATPQEAGAALFNAVYAAWSAKPAASRAQLVVAGESLGVVGGTAAFTSVEDMLARTQGAVWSGGPSFTPMVSTLMSDRNPGSPQILPVIDSGRHIRFSTGRAGLESDLYGRSYAAWESPRLVFVQHPSDPIVWWNPTSLTAEPDWLKETRGDDVLPGLRWVPFVTFFQLSSDMAVGLSPSGGHGHRYWSNDLLPAWQAVLDITPTDPAALVKTMTITVSTDE